MNKRDHVPNLGQVLKLHSGQKIDDPRKNPRLAKKTRDQRKNPATNEKIPRPANKTRDPRQLDYLMELTNLFIYNF